MIDIGVNLTNPQFDGKTGHVLKRAREAGVEQIIITGTDLQSSIAAAEICSDSQYQSDEYPLLSSTAGVHPHDASRWNRQTETRIRQLLESPRVVATGETGLDFNRNFSTTAEQTRAFTRQLELACETGKPLFLHERDAFEKESEILNSFGKSLPPAVIHCFTGNRENLNAYLGMGLYIGITGWVCDERRGQELAEIVSDIPLDRLMIETDAPYLLPRTIRPKPKSRTNEPAYLNWVAEKISECYGLNVSDIRSKTTDNARRFFRL